MSEEPVKPQNPSNRQVLLFVGILSFVCALILSLLASGLRKPQERAKELDRSKQMLIAAKIFDPKASEQEILEIYKTRFIPLLVDDKGLITTFEEQKIDINNYLNAYRKTGYYKQPQKLVYKILPDQGNPDGPAIGYVIPVNGLGLWDAIYGYLAVETDGNTVIGISWYDQKETPGLGANIAEASWQDHFPGKKLFQESTTGQVDFKTAPLGITVVKGKVKELLGNSPKANSAVDGMPGATLTGNGVTTAYRDVLNAYRPFLMGLNEAWKKNRGPAK